MGIAVSKLELENEGIAASKDLIVTGLPNAVRNKRNASRTPNSSHRRGRFDDCFGLDESQSRSTESTQGSPDIDMYPSKSTREARRSSFSSSHHGRPKWFRRQSNSGIGTHKEVEAYNNNNNNTEQLPPSYLVFKNHEKTHQSLPMLNSQSSGGKTAPVPVQTRKSRSMDTMGGWGSPSEEGFGGDDEAQMDELQRMYDLRTWDMYIRIMEARKNRPTPNTMIPHQQQFKPLHANDDYDYFTPGDESTDDPNLLLDASQSEEMIFGDLE